MNNDEWVSRVNEELLCRRKRERCLKPVFFLLLGTICGFMVVSAIEVKKLGFEFFSILVACTALMAVIYTIVFRDDLGIQDVLLAILCRDSLLTDEDRKNINWDVIIRKGNHSKSTRIGWEIAIIFIIGLTAGIVCTIKLIN